jgi:hypothetical protein
MMYTTKHLDRCADIIGTKTVVTSNWKPAGVFTALCDDILGDANGNPDDILDVLADRGDIKRVLERAFVVGPAAAAVIDDTNGTVVVAWRSATAWSARRLRWLGSDICNSWVTSSGTISTSRVVHVSAPRIVFRDVVQTARRTPATIHDETWFDRTPGDFSEGTLFVPRGPFLGTSWSY